jgi:NAD+ dependent glucose-6-phosphate dehydrogenase
MRGFLYRGVHLLDIGHIGVPVIFKGGQSHLKKVLVTGASGEIGTIVREDLAEKYELIPVARRELPEPASRRIDISSDYYGLRDAAEGCDAILHLAYVEEDLATVTNLAMVKNVCRVALEINPHPRLVMASSIHAVGGHLDWSKGHPGIKLSDDCRLLPNGVYGAFKCYMEVMGEFHASRGLEVVVLRFGGVRRDDRIVDEPGYSAFWLSRRDCAHIIERAIDAELPRRFVRVFAISDNADAVHDITGARELLGYEPAPTPIRGAP